MLNTLLRTLPITIYTQDYIAAGSLVTRQPRVIDSLENETRPFLPIERARVQPVANVAETLGNTTSRRLSLFVTMSQILLVVPGVPEGMDRLPGRADPRTTPNYVPKYPVLATVYSRGAVVQGHLYIPRDQDVLLGLSGTAQRFLALTEATVHLLPPHHPSPPQERELVIVSRENIQGITVTA